jgi:hypothetical protein
MIPHFLRAAVCWVRGLFKREPEIVEYYPLHDFSEALERLRWMQDYNREKLDALMRGDWDVPTTPEESDG